MGRDINYQAMPESCVLLDRARREPGLGANLEFFKSYALASENKVNQGADDKDFVEFVGEARQVVAAYPSIEHRNFWLGRRWDMLYYLLSERRRNGESRNWNHWVEKALFGGEVLNEATQTTIGVPIRYLHPTEVLTVTERLSTVTPAMLRSNWNPKAMNKADVYKIHSDEKEECFNWIQKDFENLTAFYELAARHREGVLSFVS